MYTRPWAHLSVAPAYMAHDAALDWHGTSCGSFRLPCIFVVGLFSCDAVGPDGAILAPGLLTSYGSHGLPEATALK